MNMYLFSLSVEVAVAILFNDTFQLLHDDTYKTKGYSITAEC